MGIMIIKIIISNQAKKRRPDSNKSVLFCFIGAGLRTKFGRAEVTMEGLAFPNRLPREPLAVEDL